MAYRRVLTRVTLPLMLLCIVGVLTAGGASPLLTQNARIGPYSLLLNYYSLPRAGQALSMMVQSEKQGERLQFTQAVLSPAKGTDANTVRVQLRPDGDTPGGMYVDVTPPIRGAWLLHISVEGSAGTISGNIPVVVEGPPEIPTWLGWLIGLLPLPLLITFIWLQVGWRRTKGNRVQQEMQQRPTF